MTLTLEDRLAITGLVSMHGHLVDEASLDELEELFTDDVVYDLSDYGQGQLEGVAAIKKAALALGDANPVAHHVTNVVIADLKDGRARVRSKGLGIKLDGSCGSVSYDDTAVRTGEGWRISYRKVSPRLVPLNGAAKAG